MSLHYSSGLFASFVQPSSALSWTSMDMVLSSSRSPPSGRAGLNRCQLFALGQRYSRSRDKRLLRKLGRKCCLGSEDRRQKLVPARTCAVASFEEGR